MVLRPKNFTEQAQEVLATSQEIVRRYRHSQHGYKVRQFDLLFPWFWLYSTICRPVAACIRIRPGNNAGFVSRVMALASRDL